MEYILKSRVSPISIRVEFEENNLRLIEFNETPAAKVSWLLKNIPIVESQLIDFCSKVQLTILPASVDISFEAFWNAYGHKVSPIKKTKALWAALTEIEKKQALAVIPKYKRFKAAEGQNMLYPTSWLNASGWLNEYVVK